MISSDSDAPRVLVILGSSRNDGNTRRLIEAAFSGTRHELVDLRRFSFSDYDYAHANRNDDFSDLSEKLASAPCTVLATPVYWYTMSALMKRFVDRLSDLVTIRQPLGRALAGKRLFVAATSTDSQLPAGFETTFESTADYLDMVWGGCLHVCFEQDLHLSQEAGAVARQFGRRVVERGTTTQL